jgi:nitric oxide reductase NorE protein
LAPVRERRVPGEEGIWVIVFGDLMVFGLFFSVFTWSRAQNLALYVHSQLALSQASGIVNTVLLLTSSWFVALAIHAARRGAGRAAQNCFGLAGLCGLLFVCVKISEYAVKISAGLTVNTDEFYMFYFMFTGIHLLHVLIGLGVLSYAWHRAGRSPAGAADLGALESCGIFWHLVDLLWIVLFAIFYLMR